MQINKVISDFRLSVNFKAASEVEIFRSLATQISINSKSIFIDETHGASKANVSFALPNGMITRCEISDLLIISKNPKSHFLRATFLQVKKCPQSNWLKYKASLENFDFQGQYNQWDLLSRRPNIKGIPPFDPPSDLLNSNISPSIGSIGVFYLDGSQLEIIYSVAEFIACAKPTASHPKFIANITLSKYAFGRGEAIVKKGLESFLTSLDNHEIGAELNPKRDWLLQYALAKGISRGMPDVTNFFDGYDVAPIDIDSLDDGISILFYDSSIRE